MTVQQAEWTRQAQRSVAQGAPPHFAPQAAELAWQRRQVQALREERGRPLMVLVLGATPELADLALEADCYVFRVDCNPAMFEAARLRETVGERHNEACVCGDWVSMGFLPQGCVDLVLGHSALNNVPHDQMAALMDELHRVLRPDGRLALRQIVTPDAGTDCLAPEVVADFRVGELTAREFYVAMRFCVFFQVGFDADTHTLDAAQVFTAVDRYFHDGRLRADEYALIDACRGAVRHTLYDSAAQCRWLERLGTCRVESSGSGPFSDAVFKLILVSGEVPA